MKTLVTRGMKFGHSISFLNPKPVIMYTKGHTLAMGAILLLASDYRLAVDNEKAKVGLNETVIGITMPQIAIEFARHKMPPKFLEKSILKAEIYNMKEAMKADIIDDVCMDAEKESKLEKLIEEYKALNLKTFKAFKMRIRSQLVENVNLDEI